MSETRDDTLSNSNDEFVFVWKIMNFKFVSKHKDTVLKSPPFSASFLKETKWYITLHPNRLDTDQVALFLYRESDSYPFGITVSYEFEITAQNYTKKRTVEKRIFQRNDDGFGFPKFVLYCENFPSEEMCKTNDKLTVQCTIRLHEDETTLEDIASITNLFSSILKQNVPDEFFPFPEALNSAEIRKVRDLNQKIIRTSHRCVVTSCIEIERIELDCAVENFTELQMNHKNCIIVKEGRQTRNCAALVWSLNSEKSLEVIVYVNKIYDILDGILNHTLNCSVAVLDCRGHAEVQLFEYLDIARSDSNVLKFSNVISFDDVISKRDTLLCNGSLAMKFQMIFSNDTLHHILTSPTSTQVKKTNNSATSDLAVTVKGFYSDHKHCDAILRFDSTDIPIHKAVVCARSPVLDALFSSDMKEKATGIVEVTDFDLLTIKRMLHYMYTDVLENMNDDEFMSLYSASDKYGFMPLMHQCSAILVENLTLNSACSVLVLADAHNDVKLEEMVLNFVCENACDFFSSDNWKDVVKNNAELACKVFEWVSSRMM